MTPVEGLLLVDKPRSWTSHDVVAAVRRLLPRKTKVGHSGTLDPMATGLLILLVGRATKSASRYQKLPKTYSGTIRLGLETDTGDLEGRPVAEKPVPAVTEDELRRALKRYEGEVDMPVPRYSAVKHKGKPLYKYARQGIAVPDKSRRTRIHSWTLSSWRPPEAGFLLRCGSGTYVRSLAMMLGREFGCGAVLSSLRRERVGDFSVSDAVAVDGIDRSALEGGLLPAAAL